MKEFNILKTTLALHFTNYFLARHDDTLSRHDDGRIDCIICYVFTVVLIFFVVTNHNKLDIQYKSRLSS